ncbi:unnamed protein product, partial [Mesorhabditis spiculigera]
MSSFFDVGRYKMFDVKKKLGIQEKRDMDEQGSGVSQEESWTELAPSRQSLASSFDGGEKIDKDSRLSPASLQSPHIEFESLEAVKYKLVREMLPPGKNTDWIWDWSSRQEAVPPKSMRMRQYGSNLTTPPNSPEPELLNAFACCDRADHVPGLSTFNFVLGMLMSNIVTFVIGAAIGFAVCKRLAKGKTL